MPQDLTDRIGAIGTTTVSGTYYRHAAVGRDAFAGGLHGRWGKDFPVIYLGRPPDSVVAEAYRHLVDAAGVPARAVRPRVIYTVTVRAREIIDLTNRDSLAAAGLSPANLTSDVDDYDACQMVATAALETGCHGILAPAATGLGFTLALFAQRLLGAERPFIVAEALWQQLPDDPRSEGRSAPRDR